MSAFYPLIRLLNELRSRGRDPGDSLGRIVLAPEEWRTLCTAVQHGFERGISSFDRADRKRWGAALLLIGAQALRTRIKDAPFTYDKIGKETGIHARIHSISFAEYAAIEEGAEVWGIDLIRVTLADGRRQRRFLGTMIQHSGAGWALLFEIAALVARRRRWEWVAGADLESIAAWIDAHAKRVLGEQVKNNLDDETREALAARLQELAAVRALLGEITDPDTALQEFGAPELTAALDAPDESATRSMLELLCRPPEEVTAGLPRWLWHLDGEGYERAVIELPTRIRLPDDLPSEVDQVYLKLLADTHPRGCLYVRDRKHGVFEHREGRRVRIPRSLHAHLIAQYRDGQETREIIAGELTVPTAPIAVFDADRGRLHAHPRSGTRIALIAAPDWRLQPPEGFIRGGKAPLEAWLGAMPANDLELSLFGPDDEPLKWTLSATQAPLQLTLTNAIAGLRLAQAPVVCGAPEFRSNIMRGRGTCTARGVGGSLDTFQVVVRGGRVKFFSAKELSTTWPAGVLSLDIELQGGKCTQRVAVLPADTEVRVVSDREGTLATLRHRDLGAKLHTRDTALPAEGDDGNLFLPPSVHGRVVIDYTLTLAGTTWSGVWRIFAHPPATEVIERNGDVRDGDNDLSVLRSGGGLRIYGEPRSTVDLQIEDECWSLRLSPDGERLFPFIEIPSEILNREAAQKQAERLRIDVRWPRGEKHTRTFIIPENEKLVAKLVPGNAGAPSCVRVAWSRPAPNDVRLEAVRAWQPWVPAISLPARPATWPDWSGKSGLEADFPLPAGSYQIALFSGERRISGATLISPDGTLPLPPSNWPPLEAELWNNPDIRRLAPLVRQWSEDGEDEAHIRSLLGNVTRFGFKWFRIADVMPEITGYWRLETLLRADKPEALDRLVAEFYEQTGLAWMFICERDLACVAARLSEHGPGAANTLLARVAELDAGLLRAAARVWSGRLRTEGLHLSSAIELQIQLNTYQPPRPRNSDEIEQIAALDPELDPSRVCVPRVLGLRQLHKHSHALSALLGELDKPTNGRLPPPPRLDPAWFHKLPERLQEQERAIATWAWSVHRWRRGENMTFRMMRGLSRLEPLARKSLDYWLNSWDLLDPPKTGDRR